MLIVIFLVVLIVLVCVIIAAVSQSRKASQARLEALRNQQTAASTPQEDKFDRLAKLKNLLDQGVLSQEEFQRERAKILSEN